MKMEVQVWTDVLAEEDIKLLNEVAEMNTALISQVYVFMDLLKQYIDLVEQTSIFAPDIVENKNDDMSDGPTQTATEPAPANRAERRAKKTPFEAVKK
jgi:hypothetical protein